MKYPRLRRGIIILDKRTDFIIIVYNIPKQGRGTPMDKLDMALLELLEEDARRTPEQVGVLLGLSAAEAKARMDGLEADGVIRGYTVLIDREQMPEETISALIEVKVQPERNRGFDAIAEQLYRFDEVKACYLMSGAYDLMLIVEGKNIRAVSRFVAERLSILDNVQSCATHFILKRYKTDGVIFEKEPGDKRMVVSL